MNLKTQFLDPTPPPSTCAQPNETVPEMMQRFGALIDQEAAVISEEET
jgi:uncharacterized membrane protein